MSLVRRAGQALERRAAPPIQWGDSTPPGNGSLGGSVGGTAVTEATALQVAAVYGSIGVLCDSMATLPVELFNSLDPARRRRLPPSQLVRQPYIEISRQDWIVQYTASMGLRGNFYGQIVERDEDHYPTQIKPIHPDQARVRRITGGKQAGRVEYRFNGLPVPIDDVFHVRYLSMPGMLEGLNPIKYLRLSLGLARAQEIYGSSYFENSANPSGQIVVPDDLDPEETLELARAWMAAHQGLGRANLPAVLTGGAEFKPISITPEDSQFLECVAPGTMFSLPDGSRREVEALKAGDRVLSWDGARLVSGRVAAVGRPRIKELVRITTARGRVLTASVDHPVLARRAMRTPGGRPARLDEWFAAGDLKPGHYVRVALGCISPQASGMTNHEAYFLGAMTGDGHIRKTSCGWTSTSPQVTERMREATESMGGGLTRTSRPIQWTVTTGGRGRRGSRIRTLLNESGLIGTHSHTKYVPPTVVSGGKDAWTYFLSGLFDADGSVRDPEGAQNPAAYISSTSRRLLDECQHLLAMLGVQSSVYAMGRAGRKRVMGVECDAHANWGLYVMGVSQLQVLAEQLDLAHPEKRRRLDAFRSAEASRYRPDNFEFDRVKSVECIGAGATIGVEIAGTHTHVTSGLITHNSRQFSQSQISGMIFRVPPHMIGIVDRSTCLAGESLVLTETGPREIRDIKVGARVWALDESSSRFTLSPVSAVAMTGVDPVLTIRTNGRELRANAKHRVLVRRKFADPQPGLGGYRKVRWDNVWVTAGELEVGDLLIAAHGLPESEVRTAPNGRRLTTGFMEVAGLLIGDGNVLSNERGEPAVVTLARHTDARYMDAYRAAIRAEFTRASMGGTFTHEYRDRRPVTLREYERSTTFTSRSAAQELADLGFSGTAKTKRIPGWVFGIAPELQLAFLRGYADADGHVNKAGELIFSSVNEQLLEDVRHLCIGLGIPAASVYSYATEPSGVIADRRYERAPVMFQLGCYDATANLRIGSHDPVDLERLETAARSAGGRRTRYCAGYQGRGGSVAARPGTDFAIDGAVLHKIVSIETSRIAEPVYDLTVEGTHTFLADGLVVHNSWGRGIEQQERGYVTNTLSGYYTRYEEAMTAIHPRERYVRFNLSERLRGDTLERFQAWSLGIASGFLCQDDARAAEHMPPLPDGLGRTFLMPINSEPLRDAALRSLADSQQTPPSDGSNDEQGGGTNG